MSSARRALPSLSCPVGRGTRGVRRGITRAPRTLLEGRPPVAREGLAMLLVEEIIGDVWHPRHLAREVTGSRGGLAALGEQPLNEGHSLERAMSLVGGRSQLEPGDRVGVRDATFEDRADHL